MLFKLDLYICKVPITFREGEFFSNIPDGRRKMFGCFFLFAFFKDYLLVFKGGGLSSPYHK